ncbi:uncharacterized protein ACBT44_010002 isoform 2-T2 [Syngnathus typhle]
MEMKHYAREDDKESQNISIHVCRELAKDLSQNKTRRGSSCRQFLEKLQDLKTWTPTNRCKTFSACRWMEVFSFVLSRTQFCKMERLRLQNPENICSPPVPNANYDLKPKYHSKSYSGAWTGLNGTRFRLHRVCNATLYV